MHGDVLHISRCAQYIQNINYVAKVTDEICQDRDADAFVGLVQAMDDLFVVPLYPLELVSDCGLNKKAKHL